jgi:ATP-dependent Lon protease
VATANQLETIPRPLLDRMEVIRLSGYILEEKLAIAKQYLIPKQLNLHGLTEDQVTISDDVLRTIIDGYAREAGVRGLENNIKKILRKSAMKIVKTDAPRVEIKVEDLHDLLGRRVFTDEKLYKEPRMGVITGMAYTSLGGATLHIEATAVPSKGPGYKHTGQLGNVMVESSEIAYTYIRSLLKHDEQATAFFENNSIHLHVPAGATPKDGPSAGITMAAAIYSLAHNRPIIDNLAMTGELTLTGLVMPIGGVKEKVIAAKRANITTLIFPAENQEDFDDLDNHIKEGLSPHFVDTFEEVLAIGFPSDSV